MSRTSIVASGRVAAEAGMVDTCQVTRITGHTTDKETGQITNTVQSVYTGKCRLQQNSRLPRATTVGEAYVFQSAYVLQLPIATSSGIQANDRVLITSATRDLDLNGRTFWVRELSHKTDATARRIGIEEVIS